MDNFDQEQEKENSVQPDENNMSRQSEYEQEDSASVGAEPPQENAEESCGETTKKGDRRATIFLFASLYLVLLICIAFMGYTLKENNRVLEEAAQENKSALVKAVDEVAKENKEGLSRALEIEYEIKSNSQLGKEAMEFAEKAASESNWELAKLYARNAIFHIPGDSKYIRRYRELLMAGGEASSIEELQQLLAIIKIAVYQVDPKEVAGLLEIQQEVSQQLMEIANFERLQKDNEQNAILEDEQNQLEEKLKWSVVVAPDGSVNMELLGQREDALSSLLDNAAIDDVKADELETELEKTNTAKQMVVVLQAAKEALKKGKDIIETQTTDANKLAVAQSQLQTANAMLSQIWTMDCKLVPELQRSAEQIQQDILDATGKILKLSSVLAMKRFEAAEKELCAYYNEAKTFASYSYDGSKLLTSKINSMVENYKKMQKEIQKIADPDMQRAAMDRLESSREKVEDVQKLRIEAYNKWAVFQIKEASDKAFGKDSWDKENELTMRCEIFNPYLLDIDTSLLTPEAQSVYWLVFNRIFQSGKTKDSVKANAEIEKAKTELKTLERF